MYSELLEKFDGRKVVEFNDADDWKGPKKVAYRLREEYDDDVSIADRLDSLAQVPEAKDLAALIIGTWSKACEGESATEIVAKLVDYAPKFPNLKALFLGDITYEECEISWINQTDVGPLLTAFPQLEVFRVRGGTELSFSRARNSALRELAIETGGLPSSVIREVFLCDLPALEHIELLTGEDDYGFDGSIEDLQPILSGQLYPKLKFLGLMNSTIANEIAAVVVNSPIIDRIEVLDLSMGNIDDTGVQSLHALAGKTNLRRVNISHHYASDESIAALRAALSCEVIAEDKQDPDEWRPVLHAE